MSSAGQAIGGVVGAVIGFYVGGPSGAYYGAQAGMMIGGLIDPPKVQGPRLDDLNQQTSTYGAFIPRIYGTAPVVGNIFWIQGNKLIEREAEDSGKGGPEVTNFEYFSSFAVGLCEGPIAGVRRIWIGGQLWYDAGASDLSSIIVSNEQAATFTLYTGSETQLADPLIQADRGVANVPAYRGLAYIVFNELPVKDYGNSLAGAQVKVELAGGATYGSALVDTLSISAESGWNTFYRVAGNQNDDSGFANYITASPTEQYPIWVRSIGGRYYAQSLGNAGLAVFTSPNAVVNGLQTSLDTLHYAFIAERRYLVWGIGHTASYWDSGSTMLTMYAFAEKPRVIYAIVLIGSDVSIIKMPESTGTERTYHTSSLPIGAEKPVISVWGTSAVTASHLTADQLLYISIYDEIEGVLAKTDSYTLTLPGTTPAGSYAIDYVDASCYVENDILYIVMVASTGATTPRTTIIKVDLLAKAILSETALEYSIGALTSPRQANVRVVNSLIYYGQMNDNATYTLVRNAWVIASKVGISNATLSTIVQSECLKSDLLTAADIDVTDLTDQVRGYRVSSLAPLRGGIDPLRKAWPFDVIQHGYKIKFKRRGGASVATITEGELDARAAGSDPGVQITNVREMDLVLPNQLTAKYLDAVREYDVNVAEESR